MRLHHIGYLAKNAEEAAEEFLRLGFSKQTGIVFDAARGVDICFVEKDGYVIELVAPAAENAVIKNMLKKTGPSPYHLCYETPDFEADFASLTAEGFLVAEAPEPAPALGGVRVAFLYSAVAGLIELAEKR